MIYKGDGLFDVDFVIAGRLDRDFAFPTIERFAYAQPFLTLSRRRDGSVRLDAPGFSALASGGGANPLMAGLGMAMAKDGASPSLPQPEGSFTLTTDAEILANNTEDGAKPAAAGKRLGWTVAPGTQAAPMAVLQLAIARQGQ